MPVLRDCGRQLRASVGWRAVSRRDLQQAGPPQKPCAACQPQNYQECWLESQADTLSDRIDDVGRWSYRESCWESQAGLSGCDLTVDLWRQMSGCIGKPVHAFALSASRLLGEVLVDSFSNRSLYVHTSNIDAGRSANKPRVRLWTLCMQGSPDNGMREVSG